MTLAKGIAIREFAIREFAIEPKNCEYGIVDSYRIFSFFLFLCFKTEYKQLYVSSFALPTQALLDCSVLPLLFV